MQTYLEQLTLLATVRGVNLRDAVLRAGISSAQWYRWRNGRTTMREGSAKKVRKAIEALANAKPAAKRSLRPAH